MSKLDWPTVLDIVERFSLKAPPLSLKAEQWMRKNPDLMGFSRSKPAQDWAEWLCGVWAAQGRGELPPFPSHLSGQHWRTQADQAEDHRGSCPVDDWLTVYVTYLHACADVIDAVRQASGWKITA